MINQAMLVLDDWRRDMAPFPEKIHGLWFEEFEPGQTLITSGRTISEADILTFAGLSGDFNQVHVNEEYGNQTIFGKRIAHGLLVLSMAVGLLVQTGLIKETMGAFREIARWKFRLPVFIGDTIHVVLKVLETRAVPRMDGGLLTIGLDVLNQKEEVVMNGNLQMFMLSDPAVK
ncbi:MAG: MaoC/PaaZ C-terminal domain-containing protein [Anaerolineales bacterium]